MLTIPTPDLRAGLARALRITGKGSQAANHVLLRVRTGDGLQLQAVGSGLGLREQLAGESSQSFEVLLPADDLHAMVSRMDSPTILIKPERANRCLVRGAGAEFTLAGLDAAEAAPLPTTGEQLAEIKLKGPDLARIVRETAYAASTERREGFNGLYCETRLEAGQQRFRIIATDGSRAAYSDCPCEGVLPGDCMSATGVNAKTLVPTEVGQLLAQLYGSQEEVTLRWTRSRILASGGSIELVGSLIDGAFPAFYAVLPADEGRHRVRLEVSPLRGALSRIEVVERGRKLHDGSPATVTTAVSLEENCLRLRSRPDETEELEQEIPAEVEGEAKWRTGLNARFWREALAAVGPSERVEVELWKALDPWMVRFDGRTDCLALLMPLRLD